MPRKRRPPQDELEYVITQADGGNTRDAGLWAKEKLASISAYCRHFTTACKKAGGGVYVDAFCGPGINRIGKSEEHVWGSAMLAVRAQPQFARLLMMDLNKSNIEALTARVGDDPRVELRIGDANRDIVEFVGPVLSSRAPMFCLLDPQGIELDWTTVASLSRPRQAANRCELLILFSDGMGFLRMLRKNGAISTNTGAQMTRFFGTDAWQTIYELKIAGGISPEEARARYAELYQAQLRGLGYKYVPPPRQIAKRGTEGRELYQLIFATDHIVGHDIMADIFRWMEPLRAQWRLL